MIQFRMKCAISHPLICICFQRWKFIFNQTFCVSILYSAVLRLFQAILIFTRLQTNFILRHVDYNWKSNTMQNIAKYYCQTHICTKKWEKRKVFPFSSKTFRNNAFKTDNKTIQAHLSTLVVRYFEKLCKIIILIFSGLSTRNCVEFSLSVYFASYNKYILYENYFTLYAGTAYIPR